MGKASKPKSPIDLINELGINKRKAFGLLRRRPPGGGGVSSVTGGGSGFINNTTGGGVSAAASGGVIVKQITPQAFDHNTGDGVPVGWCPNASRTSFLIIDSDVMTKSVVAANISSATNSFGDASAIKVKLINYTSGTDKGFLITCETAPASTSNLNYAIFNPTTSTDIVSSEKSASGGDDGGTCSTISSGSVYAMKINTAQGLKTGGTIFSIAIKSCASGGNARLKILGDLVSCGFDPFSHPGGVIAETDSFPLVEGWNTILIDATIPHDPYYSGAAGCGANNPSAGAVWIAVEVDTTTSFGYYPVTPFFGYTYVRSHTYGPGSPSFNYPTDIQTYAFNVKVNWYELTP